MPWFIHCRLDSSPQFGKDYFMTECDIFRPSSVQSWKDISAEGVLVTRLLVGQGLGARASGVVVKTEKVLHQLALEPFLNWWRFLNVSCSCSCICINLPLFCSCKHRRAHG